MENTFQSTMTQMLENLKSKSTENNKLNNEIETLYRQFRQELCFIFGSTYLNEFTEEKVAGIKQINEILNTNQGIIISGGVGVGKTMALIYIYEKLFKYL